MSKFMMFSRKSVRKMGLLVLLLSLAAAPRAWGSFDVSGTYKDPTPREPAANVNLEGGHYFYENGILYVKLGERSNVTIKGTEMLDTRKGIVVNLEDRTNSDTNLTLEDLTVSSDAGGVAFLLQGDINAGSRIIIEGAVTLSGDIAGFLASHDIIAAGGNQFEPYEMPITLYTEQNDAFKVIGRNGLSADSYCSVTLRGHGSFEFTGSGSGNGGIAVPGHYSVSRSYKALTLSEGAVVRATGLEGASGVKVAELKMEDDAKLYARGGDLDSEGVGEGEGGAGIDAEKFEMEGRAAIESAIGGDGTSRGGDGIRVTGMQENTGMGGTMEKLNFSMVKDAKILCAKGGAGAAPGRGIYFSEPGDTRNLDFRLYGFIKKVKAETGTNAFAFGDYEIRSADVTVSLEGPYMLSVILPEENGIIAGTEFMSALTDMQGKGTVWFPAIEGAKVAVYDSNGVDKITDETLSADADLAPDTNSVTVDFTDPPMHIVNLDIVRSGDIGSSGDTEYPHRYTYVVKTQNLLLAEISDKNNATSIDYFIELSGAEGIQVANPNNKIAIEPDPDPDRAAGLNARKGKKSIALASDSDSDSDSDSKITYITVPGRGELTLYVNDTAKTKFDGDQALTFWVHIYGRYPSGHNDDAPDLIANALRGTLSLKGGTPQGDIFEVGDPDESGGDKPPLPPGPSPLPEEPVTTYPELPLPVPSETPAGIAGVSVTTEDGTTL
ncbi:MAG: hypothetical protein LBO82_00625, partial [Synergistaceae bacterium]|nr:hypothetical protein [Synergistaceae bacterium]